jgi:hypothetical protein
VWSWCPPADELDRNHWNVVFAADDGTSEIVRLEFAIAVRGAGIPDEPDDGPDDGPADDPADDPRDDPADDPGQDPPADPNDSGDCCSTHEGAGCSQPSIEDCVCDDDPYCCDTAWDTVCVGKVGTLGCGTCGDGGTSACCSPSTASGCSMDAAIEQCVCAEDPYCCTDAWDALCVESIATLGCGAC